MFVWAEYTLRLIAGLNGIFAYVALVHHTHWTDDFQWHPVHLHLWTDGGELTLIEQV